MNPTLRAFAIISLGVLLIIVPSSGTQSEESVAQLSNTARFGRTLQESTESKVINAKEVKKDATRTTRIVDAANTEKKDVTKSGQTVDPPKAEKAAGADEEKEEIGIENENDEEYFDQEDNGLPYFLRSTENDNEYEYETDDDIDAATRMAVDDDDVYESDGDESIDGLDQDEEEGYDGELYGDEDEGYDEEGKEL